MLGQDEIREWAANAARCLSGADPVVIIPDDTRPGGKVVGQELVALHGALPGGASGRKVPVLVATGTHKPMALDAFLAWAGIAEAEWAGLTRFEFVNHRYDDFDAMSKVGYLDRRAMLDLSEGRLDISNMRLSAIPVWINRLVVNASDVLVLGDCQPHEVAGMSGMAKGIVPGCSGEEITGPFHWLSAANTIAGTIGRAKNPARAVIDRCVRMISGPKFYALTHILKGDSVVEMFSGNIFEVYPRAAARALQESVVRLDRRYQVVVAESDQWTGA
jgi:nickel-dependent lactate racemase